MSSSSTNKNNNSAAGSDSEDDYGAPPPPGGGGLDGTGKFDTSAIRAQRTAQFDPDDAPPPMKRSSTVTLEGGNELNDDESNVSDGSYPTSPWGHGMAPAQSFRLYATNSMMIPTLSGNFGAGGGGGGMLGRGNSISAFGLDASGYDAFDASVTGFSQSVTATPRQAHAIIRTSMASLKKFLFTTGENIGTHNAKPPELEQNEVDDANVVLLNKDVKNAQDDVAKQLSSGSFDNVTSESGGSPGSGAGISAGGFGSGNSATGLNSSQNLNNTNSHNNLNKITPPLFGIMTTPASGRPHSNSLMSNTNNNNNNTSENSPAAASSTGGGVIQTQNNNNINIVSYEHSRNSEGGSSPTSGVFPSIQHHQRNTSGGGRPFNIGNYSITSVTSAPADDTSFENLRGSGGGGASGIGQFSTSQRGRRGTLSGETSTNPPPNQQHEVIGAERVLNGSMSLSARDRMMDSSNNNKTSHRNSPTLPGPPSHHQKQRPSSASITQSPEQKSALLLGGGSGGPDSSSNQVDEILNQGAARRSSSHDNINNTELGAATDKINMLSTTTHPHHSNRQGPIVGPTGVSKTYSDVSWAASSSPTSSRQANEGNSTHDLLANTAPGAEPNIELPKKLENSTNASAKKETPGTARGNSAGASSRKPISIPATAIKSSSTSDDDDEDNDKDDNEDEEEGDEDGNAKYESGEQEAELEEGEEGQASSPHFNKQEGPSSSLRRGPQVGQGGFATVYVGLLSHGKYQRVVAIKEIEFDTDVSSAELKNVAQEFELLRSFKHPNVIRYVFFDYSTSQKVCRIVMEYVSAGSLQAITMQGRLLSENVLREFTRQLLEGIAYIHSHGISHRDIKPANVLLHHDGTVKLADFGCSRCLNQLVETSKHVFGSPIFMAPEQIEGDIMAASDIWSLGCTILELATGKQPWYETGLKQNLYLMFHITGNDTIPYFPQTLGSPEFREFLKSCFTRDASARPTAKELLEHPWILMKTDEATHSFNNQHHNNSSANQLRRLSTSGMTSGNVTPTTSDIPNTASSGAAASNTNNNQKEQQKDTARSPTPSGIEATLNALGQGSSENNNNNTTSNNNNKTQTQNQNATSHSGGHRSSSPHSQSSSSHHHHQLTAKQEIEEVCAKQVSIICSQLIGLPMPQSPLPASASHLNLPRRESIAAFGKSATTSGTTYPLASSGNNNNNNNNNNDLINKNNNDSRTESPQQQQQGTPGSKTNSEINNAVTTTTASSTPQRNSGGHLAVDPNSKRMERSNSIMSLASNPTSSKNPVVRASSHHKRFESSENINKGGGGASTSGGGSSGTPTLQQQQSSSYTAFQEEAPSGFPVLGVAGTGQQTALSRKMSMVPGNGAGAGAFAPLPEQQQQQIVVEIEEAVQPGSQQFSASGNSGQNINMMGFMSDDGNNTLGNFSQSGGLITPYAQSLTGGTGGSMGFFSQQHQGSQGPNGISNNNKDNDHTIAGTNNLLNASQDNSAHFANSSGGVEQQQQQQPTSPTNQLQQNRQNSGESYIVATTATITDAFGTVQGARLQRSKSLAGNNFSGFGETYPSPAGKGESNDTNSNSQQQQQRPGGVSRILSTLNVYSREQTPRANDDDNSGASPPNKNETNNNNNTNNIIGSPHSNHSFTNNSGQTTPTPQSLGLPQKTHSTVGQLHHQSSGTSTFPRKSIKVAVPIAPDAPPVVLELGPEDLSEAPFQNSMSNSNNIPQSLSSSQQQQQQQQNLLSFPMNSMNNTNTGNNVFGSTFGDQVQSFQSTLQATGGAGGAFGGFERRRSSAAEITSGKISASESPFSNSSLQPSNSTSAVAGAVSSFSQLQQQPQSYPHPLAGAQTYASFRLERTASIAAAGGTSLTNHPSFQSTTTPQSNTSGGTGASSSQQQQQQQHMMMRKKSYVVNLTDNVRQQLQNAMMERKKSLAAAGALASSGTPHSQQNTSPQSQSSQQQQTPQSATAARNVSGLFEKTNSNNENNTNNTGDTRNSDHDASSKKSGLDAEVASSSSGTPRSYSRSGSISRFAISTTEPKMTIPTQEIEDEYAQQHLTAQHSFQQQHYGSMRRMSTATFASGVGSQQQNYGLVGQQQHNRSLYNMSRNTAASGMDGAVSGTGGSLNWDGNATINSNTSKATSMSPSEQGGGTASFQPQQQQHHQMRKNSYAARFFTQDIFGQHVGSPGTQPLSREESASAEFGIQGGSGDSATAGTREQQQQQQQQKKPRTPSRGREHSRSPHSSRPGTGNSAAANTNHNKPSANNNAIVNPQRNPFAGSSAAQTNTSHLSNNPLSNLSGVMSSSSGSNPNSSNGGSGDIDGQIRQRQREIQKLNKQQLSSGENHAEAIKSKDKNKNKNKNSSSNSKNSSDNTNPEVTITTGRGRSNHHQDDDDDHHHQQQPQPPPAGPQREDSNDSINFGASISENNSKIIPKTMVRKASLGSLSSTVNPYQSNVIKNQNTNNNNNQNDPSDNSSYHPPPLMSTANPSNGNANTVFPMPLFVPSSNNNNNNPSFGGGATPTPPSGMNDTNLDPSSVPSKFPVTGVAPFVTTMQPSSSTKQTSARRNSLTATTGKASSSSNKSKNTSATATTTSKSTGPVSTMNRVLESGSESGSYSSRSNNASRPGSATLNSQPQMTSVSSNNNIGMVGGAAGGRNTTATTTTTGSSSASASSSRFPSMTYENTMNHTNNNNVLTIKTGTSTTSPRDPKKATLNQNNNNNVVVPSSMPKIGTLLTSFDQQKDHSGLDDSINTRPVGVMTTAREGDSTRGGRGGAASNNQLSNTNNNSTTKPPPQTSATLMPRGNNGSQQQLSKNNNNNNASVTPSSVHGSPVVMPERSISNSSFRSEDSLPSVVSSARPGQQHGTIIGKSKSNPKELTPSVKRERKR